MGGYSLRQIQDTLNSVAEEKGANWRVRLHRHLAEDLVDVGFYYFDFDDVVVMEKTVREEELRHA